MFQVSGNTYQYETLSVYYTHKRGSPAIVCNRMSMTRLAVVSECLIREGANYDSDLYGSFPLCGHVMTSISPRVLA